MDQNAPSPRRHFGELTLHMTAAEGFPALEELAMNAQRSLWLGFRVFDPATRLRHPGSDGGTWTDLLEQRLKDGISVRVLLSDFDPIAAPELHASTWRSVCALNALNTFGDLQVLPIRHNARLGSGLRLSFWLPVLGVLEKQRQALNDSTNTAERFRRMPGLWRYLWLDRKGRVRWRLPRMPRLFPASVHQKLAAADGTHAMIGGLDINERRYDDPAHNRNAADTWHDVSLTVDGPVSADIARHFAQVWNDNRLTIAALHREHRGNAPRQAADMPEPVTSLAAPDMTDKCEAGSGVQLLRTISANHRGTAFQFSPRTVVDEIERAHLDMIARARHCIYVETQFLRSHTIADALANAARQRPELDLILILPAAPEDVAFSTDTGLSAQMGEHLQAKCLETLSLAFAERLTVLSPSRQVRSASDGRDQLHGAEIIYLHAKVMVIDATEAIIGSANLNGRSMRWDTEAALHCNDPDVVARLRDRLIRHWAPDDTIAELLPLKGTAESWRAMADADKQRRPEDRKCLLLPYDFDKAASEGMPVPGFPEEFV